MSSVVDTGRALLAPILSTPRPICVPPVYALDVPATITAYWVLIEVFSTPVEPAPPKPLTISAELPPIDPVTRRLLDWL